MRSESMEARMGSSGSSTDNSSSLSDIAGSRSCVTSEMNFTRSAFAKERVTRPACPRARKRRFWERRVKWRSSRSAFPAGSLEHDLERAAHHRQRSAQLVGDVGDELLLLLLRGGDRVQARVERLRDLESLSREVRGRDPFQRMFRGLGEALLQQSKFRRRSRFGRRCSGASPGEEPHRTLFRRGRFPHPIADTADGLDDLLALPRIELLAQRVDVDVDDVRRELEGVLPDARLDLGAGHDLAPAPEEELEERPLPGRQAGHLASPRHLARLGIVRQVSERQRPGLRRLRAPRKSAQPGKELAKGESLDDVVVGPCVQPFDLVLDRVPRRQHEDLDADASRANLAADIQPVAGAGEQEVENQQVERAGLEPREGGIGIAHGLDRVALLRQSLLQELRDLGLVLDDKHSHDPSPFPPGSPAGSGRLRRANTKAAPAPAANPPAKADSVPGQNVKTTPPAATRTSNSIRETSAGGTSALMAGDSVLSFAVCIFYHPER